MERKEGKGSAMAGFNVQQKATIDNYRSANNLGFMLSDEAVAELIKKDMEKSGVVYPGFESLAKSVAKSQVKQSTQSMNSLKDTNIFGFGFSDTPESVINFNKQTIPTAESKMWLTVKGRDELLGSESELAAYNFLNNIFENADETFQNKLQTEGAVSDLVNCFREVFNQVATREELKAKLSETYSDLSVLDNVLKNKLVWVGSYEKVGFEDAFINKRGVEFNPDNIADCQTKCEEYTQTSTIINGIDNAARALVNANTSGDINKEIISTLKLLGITDTEAINQFLNYVFEKHKDNIKGECLELEVVNSVNNEYWGDTVIKRLCPGKDGDGRAGIYDYLTNNLTKILKTELLTMLNQSKATMLGIDVNSTEEDFQKLLNEKKEAYMTSFEKAYGSKELQELAEHYVRAQQTGEQYVHMGITFAAIVTSMLTGGLTSSLAMGAAMLQPTMLLERSTDADGLTKDEALEYGKMLLQQAPWMVAGMGMGKLGDMACSAVKLSKLQALATKSGQSLDDLIKTLGSNVDDATKAFLKKTNTLAQTAGISTELALDLSTTLLVYRDVKSEDWLMAFVGALSGSKARTKILELKTPDARAKYLMDTFKDLKLTPEEAERILKSMDDISSGKLRAKDVKPLENHHNAQMLDEVVVTAKRSEIEINGQRFSTNDVAEVRGEAVVENSLSQKTADKNTRIETTLEQRMTIDLEPDSPAYILYSRLEKAESIDVFEGIKSNIDLVTDKAQKDLLYKKYLFEIQRISSEETKVFLNKVLANETLLDNPLIYQICDEILKKPQKPDYIPIPTLIDKLHLTGPYMQYKEKSYCESKLKSNQYLLKVADFFVSNPKLYENPAIENQIKKVINFQYSEKIANDIIAGMELYLKNNKWQENNIVIDNIEILFKRFKTVEEKEGLINYFIKCFSDEEYVPEANNNLSTKQILLDKIGKKINTNPELKNSNNIKEMLTDIYFNSNKELEIELLNKFFDTDLITKDLFFEFKNFCRSLKSSDKSTIDAISNFIDFYKKNPKLFENCEDRELYLTLIKINDKNIDLIKTLYSRNDIDNNSIYSLINNLTDDNMGLIFDLYSTNELSLIEIDYIALATNSNSKIDAKIKVDFCKYLQKHKDIPVSDWFHLISNAAPIKGNEYKTALLYKLIENKDFPNELLSSVMYSVNKDNIGLIEKFCLDSSFPKDKLIRTIANLHDEIRIKFAEKLYKDKRISNEYISNLLGFNVDNVAAYEKIIFDDKISIDILANLDSNARYNISEKNLDSVQDLLRNYKKYGIYEEQLNCIINSNLDINPEKFVNLNKLLDKETLLKLNDIEILICADNLNLIGKKSISDLSKTEKRNLFNVLLANKAAIEEGKIDNLQELIPILPQNTDEYVQMINRFKYTFQVDESKTLSLNSKKLLENSLRDLDNSLATTNVINDIELGYSHKDFVEKINFILKDLTPKEQIQIQDMFGFKIIDGKLTGYPDANMHLENFLNPDLVIKIQKEIEKFTNNRVIVENNPQLSNTLNSLIKYCPEILNQIDNSNDFKKVLQQLQITLSKKDFKQLSINDKKIVIFAHLLGNTDKHLNTRVDSACESFLISQKLGFTKEESLKLYSIIEMLNAPEVFMATSKKATIKNYRGTTIEGQERQDVFDLLAFKMKEGNLLNITKLVYDSKYPENFTRHFNNLLEKRIQEIKANDFSLPQTAASTYKKLATETKVFNNNKIYTVNVVNAEEIPNFYAIVHTPEAGFATGGSRNANFANFKLFEMLGDDKIICTSYITADKAALVKEFHNGFIFEVPNDKQYVGYGTDIFSLGKNIPDMVVEYFRDRGLKANNSRGEKWNHRTFISKSLKRELYGIVRSKLKDVDSKYIERLDYIKVKLGNKPLTIENLREIDPEFANAYERVLKSKGMNIFSKKLLNSSTHNEVLVSNPKISAIFTDNIDNLPEEYLIKAQEENLPIVIIQTR